MLGFREMQCVLKSTTPATTPPWKATWQSVVSGYEFGGFINNNKLSADVLKIKEKLVPTNTADCLIVEYSSMNSIYNWYVPKNKNLTGFDRNWVHIWDSDWRN